MIAVDPAYTSRRGAEHWLTPLREHHPELTGHHAAALTPAGTGRRQAPKPERLTGPPRESRPPSTVRGQPAQQVPSTAQR
ncbi:MAG TPA: hypothetical protein VGD91_08120 [Trebonia sp.]